MKNIEGRYDALIAGTGAAGLCERCRESLHLCDAENYARRKIRAKNARTAAQTLPNADDL